MGMPLLAAVADIEDFLLGETMTVGEALGINQLRAKPDEALLEALGLGDAAERSDFFSFDQLDPDPVRAEDIFEIERLMDAFDNAGLGVLLGDSFSQLDGVAIALGNE